ncbi:hypothetical protein [uncultured Erythrobacter sp.]|uniref:hypothetical protein n=1 Tax=uncultured Erythrobacter sp. TaxID=263913 RepID=UPI00263592FB|nr:hypothetical protein [uncultured Erythrobacter sp.]
MDDSRPRTSQAIYTEIGMLMEDAAVVALNLGGERDDPDTASVQELEGAVLKIVALMKAAQFISE